MPATDSVGHKATPIVFEDDPRWVALTKITRSDAFAKAPRLSQLLVYLATQTLLGRSDRVTEFELAFEVFDRDKDFDPAADTIVRSHLARLRQRLLQADFGDTTWILTIPKGQYGLLFQEVLQPVEAKSVEVPRSVEAPQLPAEPSAQMSAPRYPVPSQPANLYRLLCAVLTILLVLAGVLFLRQSKAAASDPLWDRLLVPGQTTTLIAADSSLVLMHHYLQHDTTLADYISGRYRQEAEKLHRSGVEPSGLIDRRYSSIADLEMTRLISEIAGSKHLTMRATFARDMTMNDLKHSNIILSGSKSANPWLELYDPQMNFMIENDYTRNMTVVRNRHPMAGEPAEFNGGLSSTAVTYGVLAFLPGIERSHNVLILEGTSVAGTESIYDLLSDEKELTQILAKFRNADGSLKHFEVLLASQSFDGNASKFQIAAFRSYS